MAKQHSTAAGKGRSARPGGGRTVATKAALAPLPFCWFPGSPPSPNRNPCTHIFLVPPWLTPALSSWGCDWGDFAERVEGGGHPRERAAVALGPPAHRRGPPRRRRAGKPFEMRGAAGHWSPGWGWERAAVLEDRRILKGSPFRSSPPTVLELAEHWWGASICGEGCGTFASFSARRRDDEGGKFLRNRPAPLRSRRRSRPLRPAGAPGAGTAHSLPRGARPRELHVSNLGPDLVFPSPSARQPDSATAAAGERGAEV